MPYELQFHPVGNGSNSGDAITIRYWDSFQWRVIVIDGGYQENGPILRDYIRSRYGTNTIDHVVSTHPDNDHIGGLSTIVSDMHVRALWIHIPERHAARIMHYFDSSRWTQPGLASALRRAYPAVTDLVKNASANGASINGAFEGAQIGPFTVLSPSASMYEGLLPQFRDTPNQDRDILGALGHLIVGVGRRVAKSLRYDIWETWDHETLREGGTTAAENESSVVLYGDLGDGPMLFTADAGLIGLNAAATYAKAHGFQLGAHLRLIQVPHHGSRNNVSPSILNRMVGPPGAAPGSIETVCAISAGTQDANHPRLVVVNALERRGLKPVCTKFGPLWLGNGIERPAGFVDAVTMPFSSEVEEYD